MNRGRILQALGLFVLMPLAIVYGLLGGDIWVEIAVFVLGLAFVFAGRAVR